VRSAVVENGAVKLEFGEATVTEKKNDWDEVLCRGKH
jgi:hypothetical protein